METRAKIPPGMPRPGPTVSYWQDPPDSIADLQSTETLPAEADFVIVGSGISGACIAKGLLERQRDALVVMVEARQTCSGATGRNGGHTKAASYRSFLAHEAHHGLTEAIKIARLEHANILATHAVARELGIDCDSMECQTVDVIYSKVHWDDGVEAIERMRQTMGIDDPAAQYQVCKADETRERFLAPDALGAFEYPAGSLSAYAFTIGVLKHCLASGLNLQSNTPAQAISFSSRGGKTLWTVKTPRGTIATPNLILATNGYTPQLLPQTQGIIVPLRGQVVAQRPGSKMPQQGLKTTYSFIYDNGYEYMITRPLGSRFEGDIVIGGGLARLPEDGASEYGNTDDRQLQPYITNYLRQCTADYFGSNWGTDHPDGRIRKEWSGIMGASADGLPYVGQVSDMPGLWISASFNGHGMVLCLKCAEALVTMVLGSKEEQIVLAHWFPQPVRMSRERLRKKFTGRTDLRAPGEPGLRERSRL